MNKNKNTQTILVVTAILAIVVAGLIAYNQNQQLKDLKKRKEEDDDLIDEQRRKLEKANFDKAALISEVKEAKTNEVHQKSMLVKLINTFQHIEPKYEIELRSILNMLEIKEYGKACMSLGKVLENLVTEKYKEHPETIEFAKKERKKSKSKIAYFDCIEYLEYSKTVSKNEIKAMKFLKDIRNEEAHEIGVENEQFIYDSSFTLGIGLISKFSNN